MNINKGKITAGLIATSIVLPMSVTMVHADENDSQQLSIEYKTITGNSVNFRKGPSTSYSSIGKFNKGTKVEYIGKNGSWINVKHNGNVGYVHGDYVSSSNDNSSNNNSSNSNSDNTVKSTKTVNGDSVNVRTGPSTSYSKITKLSKGAQVGFISESNGWSKISYNGKIGYMSSQYLSNKSETPTPIPPVTNTDNTVKSTKVVNGDFVNVRTGPSTSYSKISQLSRGAQVGFISESNGWSKISNNGSVGYMSSQYLSNKTSSDDSSTNLPSSNKADSVINFAKKYLGKPYVWGSEGPNSFDCSGFTQYMFKNAVGVSIPRVSRDQSKFGQSISRNQIQKGDLIFFDTDGSNNGYVSHVGIYMGNNQFIHASSSGKKVMISSMSSYYNNAFVNARRVL